VRSHTHNKIQIYETQAVNHRIQPSNHNRIQWVLPPARTRLTEGLIYTEWYTKWRKKWVLSSC